MKLGILGSGKIVQEVIQVLEEIDDIEVVAIAARNREKLEKFSRDHNIGRFYTSIDELLDDSNVEVVYIGLPNNLHYDAMKKAIARGKNIICEKPFTSNISEAGEIHKLADEAGVMVVEAMSHRFIPNASRVKSLIGDLGDIKLVSFNYSQYSSRYDAFMNGKIAPAFSLESSGGCLMDLNLYNIAFAVDTFGKAEEVYYFANMDRGIDTSGIAILDYGDFKVSCIGSKDTDAPLTNTIQGTKGSIIITDALNSFGSFEFRDKDYRHFNFNDDTKSRIYYEFVESSKIFSENDRKRVDELMDMTLDYMEVMTNLRKSAEISFPADNI